MSGFSLVQNDGLCDGIPEFHLPACPVGPVMHARRLSRLLPKIFIPTALSLVLLLFAFYILIWRRKSRKMNSTDPSLLEDNYPRVSYAELARGGFASSNLIGAGTYGCVYKGILPLKTKRTLHNEDVAVAVKVFHLHQVGSSKSFLAECEASRRIYHRNVVGIRTCCSSIDYKGDDFKALVFEFMPKYSLDKWLHPVAGGHEQMNGLSMIQRLNIVVDVSNALDYFHNDCQPSIIHCDLKPSNILLDEDFNAKVGDFGLAKIVSDSTSRSLVDSGSSIGIRGTIGYVAPEYGVGRQVLTLGDVYSFGIILLEMFIGKALADDMFY